MSDKRDDSNDSSLDFSNVDSNSFRLSSTGMAHLSSSKSRENNGSESGRSSPIRTRTMKEFEQQLADLQKENFNLKLRIYFLEEDGRKRNVGSSNDIYQFNIELKVEVESLRRELVEKTELLKKASSALDGLAANHEAEMRAMQERWRVDSTLQVQRLREEIALLERISCDKDQTLKKTNKELTEVNGKLAELSALYERLKEENSSTKELIGKVESDLMDSSVSEKNASRLEEQVSMYEDELDKKNQLIEQLRCALKVKDVLIEQAESEKNEVESKWKSSSRIGDSGDESLPSHMYDNSSDEEQDRRRKDPPADRAALETFNAGKYCLNKNNNKVSAGSAGSLLGRSFGNIPAGGDEEKLLLENYVEKLSDRLKDREDAIKNYEKVVKDLEGKCLALMEIVEELKSAKSEGNTDYGDDEGDGAYEEEEDEEEEDEEDDDARFGDEGMKSSWSELRKRDSEEPQGSSGKDSESRDFNNISHLQWKDSRRFASEDQSESSRQSSAGVRKKGVAALKRASRCKKMERLEKENVDLKERLWAMEQQFDEWKHDEETDHLDVQRTLKIELQKTLEAKDNLEEQCSELEEELFRMKKHFEEVGSFVVDFEGESDRLQGDAGGSGQFGSNFMEKLTSLKEVFDQQEKEIKQKEDIISAMEAKNVEAREELEKQMRDVEEMRERQAGKEVEAKLRECKARDDALVATERLKEEFASKMKSSKETIEELKSQMDDLEGKCRDVETLKLNLNDKLSESKHSVELLTKKLAASDGLGLQLSSLLKEGSEITRQLNCKVENLTLYNHDLQAKLDEKCREFSVREEEMRELRIQISKSESVIADLKEELADRKGVEREVARKDELIGACKDRIAKQDSLIEELNKKLTRMCADVKEISFDALGSGIGTTSVLFREPAEDASGGKSGRGGEAAGGMVERVGGNKLVAAEKDNLIRRWSDLVCAVEKELKKEAMDMKAWEGKWNVMLMENDSLLVEKDSLEFKMQKEIKKRDILIENLKGEIALLTKERESSKGPHRVRLSAVDAGHKTLLVEVKGESNSSGPEIISGAGKEVVIKTRYASKDDNTKMSLPNENRTIEDGTSVDSSREDVISEESSLQIRLTKAERELENANDVIHYLKEHIKLHSSASDDASKAKFNPELIVRLVQKINSLKEKLPTGDSNDLSESGKNEASQGPVPFGDGEPSSGRPSVQGSEGMGDSGACVASQKVKLLPMTPLVETRLKNDKVLERLQEEISNLKCQFRQRISTSARPSFGRLSELYSSHVVCGMNASNRATGDFSLQGVDAFHSLVPDFDSTHVDSQFSECDRETGEGRMCILSDLLAESEGRCRMMRDRLKELMVFLRKLLTGGQESILGELETSAISNCLDDTEGLLENISHWFDEREEVMEASFSIGGGVDQMFDGSNSFTRRTSSHRFSSVGHVSIRKPSMGKVSEEVEEERLETRGAEGNAQAAVVDRDASSSELSVMISQRETELRTAFEKEVEELMAAKDDLERKLLVVKEEEDKKVSRLQMDLEKCSRDLAAAEENIRAKTTEMDRLCQVVKQDKHALVALESKYQSIFVELDQQRTMTRSLEKEMQEKLKKFVEAERRAANLETRCQELQHKFEVLGLEKDSIEKRLIDERSAVRSALSEGVICVASAPVQSSAAGRDEELEALKEERDALSRKVLELSQKGSILTSEVICGGSFGREEVEEVMSCTAGCCERSEHLMTCVSELKGMLAKNNESASEMREQLHKLNLDLTQKKVIIHKLDSKCQELEALSGSRVIPEDQQGGDDLCIEEYQVLNKVLKAEVTLLKKSLASAQRRISLSSGGETEVLSSSASIPSEGDACENKENLKLVDVETPDYATKRNPDDDSQDMIAQVGSLRSEFEKMLESNEGLRKQLQQRLSGDVANQDRGEGTCDHSFFTRKIEKLEKLVVALKQTQSRSDQSSAQPQKDGSCKTGINRIELIEQINKTRKVLAQTTVNLDMARLRKSSQRKVPSNVDKTDQPGESKSGN